MALRFLKDQLRLNTVNDYIGGRKERWEKRGQGEEKREERHGGKRGGRKGGKGKIVVSDLHKATYQAWQRQRHPQPALRRSSARASRPVLRVSTIGLE